jgi:UDP-N-acetylmuramoylalanine--D-glutamate ligase
MADLTAPAQLRLFDLDGRSVLVLGLGESGLAMARWAALRGARVAVADTRAEPPQLGALREAVPGARFVPGPFCPELLDGVDALLWSPGLSIERGDSAGFHSLARERGVPVLGEIELFAQALAGLRDEGYAPKLIAITGTNGKTTTTRLVAHLCAHAGRSVAVAGNIAPAALDVLREAAGGGELPGIWVLELSSFQLALTESLMPDAAAVLNVSQDHLDWHASMDSYVQAKRRIYRNAPVCVFDRDDPATEPPRPAPALREAGPRLRSFALTAPAAAGELGIVHEGGLRWLAEAVPGEEPPGRRRREPAPPVVRRLMPADALRVRGAHNQRNALAALALAQAADVPMSALLHGLRSYEGEPHRCALVATIGEVEYYDDSKGTNVGATAAALTGLGRRCVLIAGGDGKGQEFSSLREPVRGHARAVVLIGRDAPALRAALADTGVPLTDCASLEEAVRCAADLARAGDAVLLSPACASLDMFRNYEHRAEVFVDAVRRLAEDAGQPC